VLDLEHHLVKEVKKLIKIITRLRHRVERVLKHIPACLIGLLYK
jgi:hypothetical protein